MFNQKPEKESLIHVLNHHATCTHTDMRSNVYEDAAICFCESLIRITQSFQRPLMVRIDDRSRIYAK